MQKIVQLISILIFAFSLLSSSSDIFAPDSNNSSKTDSLKTYQFENPLMEKISQKGSILVQLKSGTTSYLDELPLEIAFLNSSKPFPLIKEKLPSFGELSPNDELRKTGETVPSVLERIIPVKSFDIIISSNDGKEIWKKVAQDASTGRANLFVNLHGYTNDINIHLNNILAVNETYNNQLQNQNSKELPVDSVEFKANVTTL